MSHFVYKLIPPRPTFACDMTDAEAAIMGDHAAYWTNLLDQGSVVVFGVVLEQAGAWGLAVVEVDDEDDLRAMAAGDPAVKSGLCTFEIGTMPNASVRPPRGAPVAMAAG
jgi:uncharacterized protein YciI